jgi:ATP citrate lyase citrate-binding
MREVGKSLDIDLYVFGPETHMTAIVAMALGELTMTFIYFFVTGKLSSNVYLCYANSC